jgi:DNA-binding SARP family transcriptional activator
MNEVYDPFGPQEDYADLIGLAVLDGLDECTVEPTRALRLQILEHLKRLQEDYQQTQSWLEGVQAQLCHRNAQVGERLRDVALLIEQIDRLLGDEPALPRESHPRSALLLEVQTLGKFVVRCQGRPLALGSNKAGGAIFRYLATLPERQAPKDVLLELFWPDEPPHRALHKLHMAISSLRHALNTALGKEACGDDSLVFTDDRYALAPGLHIQLDTDAFVAHIQAGERLEREGSLTAAIDEYEVARALYHGDFLIEDLYADWTVAKRARYEEMFLTVLGRLALTYADQDRATQSIACCRQILERDSFREDAYRQLMRCYSRIGHRNQALREFQTCQEIIERELGVEPMRETVELYERIAREEPV